MIVINPRDLLASCQSMDACAARFPMLKLGQAVQNLLKTVLLSTAPRLLCTHVSSARKRPATQILEF